MSYSSYLSGLIDNIDPQQVDVQGTTASNGGSSNSMEDGPSTGPKTRDVKRVPDLTFRGHGIFFMAPLKTDLHITVIKQMICIKSSQTFVNNSDNKYTDVQFDLPLPSILHATIFRYRIGDGDIVTKMTSRKDGNTDKSHTNHCAMDHASNLTPLELPKVVSASLPVIPPRTKVVTELTMYTIVGYDRDENSSTNWLSFTVPSTFGRRYGLIGDWEDPEQIYVRKPGLTLTVEILRAEYVTAVDSSSHTVCMQKVLADEEGNHGLEKLIIQPAEDPTNYFGWLRRSFVIQIESIDDFEPPTIELPARPPFALNAASEGSGSTSSRDSEDGTAAARATVADDLPGPGDGAGGDPEASNGNTSQEAQNPEVSSHHAPALEVSVRVKVAEEASEGDTSQEIHVGSHDPAPLMGFPPVSFAAEASEGVTDQQQEPGVVTHDTTVPISPGPVRAPRGMLPLLSSPAPPLPVEASPIPVGQQPLPQVSGSAAAIVTTRRSNSEPDSPALYVEGGLYEMYEDMKKYLWVLLMFQRHDGSIHFENRAEAETILGQEIADMIVEVEGTETPDDRAYSTAVVTILHKNFAFARDYWLCLHCKTMEYVDQLVRGGYLTRHISTSVGPLMPPISHIVHSRRDRTDSQEAEAPLQSVFEEDVTASPQAESVADSQGTITPCSYCLMIMQAQQAMEQDASEQSAADAEGYSEN